MSERTIVAPPGDSHAPPAPPPPPKAPPHGHAAAVPVGGPLLTGTMRLLLVVALVGAGLMAWRFAVGLGPTTALNDGYPWGLWIAFDVVTGTALACGGYAVALLVYILNRGRYHPLVRPAILTSALGYSLAAIAIVVDVGRPWLIYRIPISVGKWNLDSALLEVALCVMAYVIVLWIEMSPALMERWRDGGGPLAGLSRRLLPVLDRALIGIVALGLLLPTMHQSSLGTVMLLAGTRLHPLWNTPLIPLLFLISCVGMGYAVVVLESALASRAWGRRREDGMLAALSGTMVFVLVAWAVIRLADLLLRGRGPLLFGSGLYSVLFWLELASYLVPAAMLARPERRRSGTLFRAAALVAAGGALYRFDTYLVAFRPAPGWSYFPSLTEMGVTIGLVALEIAAYIYLVKRFPILGGAAPAGAQARGSA